MNRQRVWKAASMRLALAVLVCGLQLSAQQADPDAGGAAKAGTFTTFDAPGSGVGASQGTFAYGINPSGAITGHYVDPSGATHGFLRARDGTITTFDAPDDVRGTYPQAINRAGSIAGYCCDEVTCHGFLRGSDSIATFDPAGSTFTDAYGINASGAITGYYTDEKSVLHGFLRAPGGAITTFDAPGAGTGSSQGTVGVGINPHGTISGCYIDANSVGHGFIRARGGTVTTFDVPNSTGVLCPGSFYTGSGPGFAINPSGAITGSAAGSTFATGFRGFLRTTRGSFDTFGIEYPPCCVWTFGTAISPSGVIVGYENDGFNVNHGYVRAPDGTFTMLDAPGAGPQGTIANAINPSGWVAGTYADEGTIYHGFLWVPPSR
jgi:hypothetical protein